MSMFDPADIAEAERLLARLRATRWTICTAESCTGGLIAGLLTEVPGASDVVDRGFVTYSNGAKTGLLGVPGALIEGHGAVSAETASAMASGALLHSPCDLAVAVTGVAGPGGGSPDKPVGLVHLAAQLRGRTPVFHVLRLGDIGRSMVRLETVRAALRLCHQALDSDPGSSTDGVP
ncbi:MAG: CinA family protein [Hyphomicrobiaceae bacterium]